MKKMYLPMLLGFMAIALIAQAQPTQLSWVRAYECFKGVPSGGVPPAIRFIQESNGEIWMGGALDSIWTFSRRSDTVKQRLSGLHNVAVRRNGVWENGGNASLLSPSATITGHITFGGKEYVGSEGAGPNFMRLNASGSYEPTPTVTLDGAFDYAYDWGSGNMLLLGKNAWGFATVNGQPNPGAAIINPTTGAVQQVTSTYGPGGIYIAGVAYKNDTLFVGGLGATQTKVWALKKGTTTWTQDVLPFLGSPCHAVWAYGFVNGKWYAVLGYTSPLRYELHRLDPLGWTKLAEMEPIDYINDSRPFDVTPITSYDGKLVIMGHFTKINGQSCKGLVYFDETTNLATNVLSTLPGNVPITDLNGAYYLDGEMHVAVRTSEAYLIAAQTMYALRDTTAPPVPNYSNPSTITVPTGSAVVINGSGAVPLTWIDLYEEGNPSLKLMSVQVGTDGTWSFNVMLSQGVHRLYVVSRDQYGNTSVTGGVITVTVNTVTSVSPDPTLPQATDSVYYGPTLTKDVVHIRGAGRVLSLISSSGVRWNVPQNNGSIDVNVRSFTASFGEYYIEYLTKKKERRVLRVLFVP